MALHTNHALDHITDTLVELEDERRNVALQLESTVAGLRDKLAGLDDKIADFRLAQAKLTPAPKAVKK